MGFNCEGGESNRYEDGGEKSGMYVIYEYDWVFTLPVISSLLHLLLVPLY